MCKKKENIVYNGKWDLISLLTFTRITVSIEQGDGWKSVKFPSVFLKQSQPSEYVGIISLPNKNQTFQITHLNDNEEIEWQMQPINQTIDSILNQYREK